MEQADPKVGSSLFLLCVRAFIPISRIIFPHRYPTYMLVSADMSSHGIRVSSLIYHNLFENPSRGSKATMGGLCIWISKMYILISGMFVTEIQGKGKGLHCEK